jgi:hypothetical protein
MIKVRELRFRSAAAAVALLAATVLSGCGGDCLNPSGCNSPKTTSSSSTPTPGPTGSYTILYAVGGTATQASLTYQNSQGGTSQEKVNLPWQRQFTMVKGDFLYLSGQNEGDTGTVTTEIRVNGALFKTTTSSGAFVIATASGSCC